MAALTTKAIAHDKQQQGNSPGHLELRETATVDFGFLPCFSLNFERNLS